MRIFGFGIFYFSLVAFGAGSSVGTSNESQAYRCANASARSGFVGIVLTDFNDVRTYAVEFSNGRVAKIGGILASRDAIIDFQEESRAMNPRPRQPKVKNGSSSQDQAKKYIPGAFGSYTPDQQKAELLKELEKERRDLFFRIATTMGRMWLESSMNNSKQPAGGFGGFAVSGSTGGMGMLGTLPGEGQAMNSQTVINGRVVSTDIYGPRTYVETRPGALIKPHGDGVVHNQTTEAAPMIETRAGALIKPHGEGVEHSTEPDAAPVIETRKGALIQPYGTKDLERRMLREARGEDQNSVGKVNKYVETRPGALIQPRESADQEQTPQVSLGQIIGRDGVTTFGAAMDPYGNISKLTYRSGLDSSVSLPSGNAASDAQDVSLNQIKKDLNKIKMFAECCANGVGRSCEGKNVVQIPAAPAEPLRAVDPYKPRGNNPLAPARPSR